MIDVIQEQGALFLGSRLKRLGERMQADVARLVIDAGVPVQPGQNALLATLDLCGPMTIGALSTALKLRQPTVTRTVASLIASGLVRADTPETDQRQKSIALTDAGAAAVLRQKLLVWPKIEAAVQSLMSAGGLSLLDDLSRLESELAHTPLDVRARREPAAPLRIRDWDMSLARAFHDINAEWVTAMYSMEPVDRDILEHPRERIIEGGGDILFVEAEGVGVIGACALRQTGEREYELTKMGVYAAARGSGAGQLLLAAVIERARQRGARLLYLLSNRKSAAAIHLYEKLGFVHDAGIMQRFGAKYQRCDVAMRHPL